MGSDSNYIFLGVVSSPTGEELEIYRAPEGGVFAVDWTYLDQVSERVHDPFSGKLVDLDDEAPVKRVTFEGQWRK